ncbi:ethanolamine kinase [Neocloeon triangulifer]|uniref:ethanolamine kinase n=1 Tax=Neocloeon triangulifer TaxID=2078957 RepID=UPI00286F3BC6|nr:ethanolamine kinase [Neocloeon triangulifer]
MRGVQELPHCPVTIEENEIKNGAAEVLKFIRPKWEKDQINYKMFTDGITNKLVACSYKNGDDLQNTDDVVLVRVYGAKTDLLIDRQAETRNLKVMHNAGYAPRLYATFENGLAYEYVPGVTLNTDTCRSLSIYPLVASMLARMHRLECGEMPKEAMVWTKCRQFIQLAPDVFMDAAKQRRFIQLKLPSKAELFKEFSSLEENLKQLKSPVVFCHNDLLLGNMIYNDGKKAVTFIDYEYAAYNHQAFDIGNHFNEFAGLSNVDYNLYPDEDFQRAWIKVYLSEFNSSAEVKEEEIQELYILVNKFALTSHFLWATWAFVQAEHSTIDFDYLKYASDRLNEYFKRKDQFLAMK